MKRGAGRLCKKNYDSLIYLMRDHVLQNYYLLEFEGTVQDLQKHLGEQYGTILYKGARLHPDIELQKLKGRELHCLGPQLPGLTQLRPWTGLQGRKVLTLIEISEYMLDVEQDETDQHRWQLDDIISKLNMLHAGVMTRQGWERQNLLQRGGAGRSKLAWESTQTIKGVRAVTEFKVDGTKIEQISTDMVCEGAVGVSFCLMAQWARLADVSSTKPLLLIFPGRCTAALRKLQVPATRIVEDEIVIQDADATTMTRRRVTMLRMSEHNWEVGSNFRSISWSPQAATEIVIEMDSRWMVDATIQEAQRDWRALAVNCASKLALTSFKPADVYGAKLLHDQPFSSLAGAHAPTQ